MLTRDQLRAKIFAGDNAKVATFPFHFFGTDLEVRQPTVGDIIARQTAGQGNFDMVTFLLEFAFVPGTDDKVFEEGDRETLKALPFNEDMQRLTDTIVKLTSAITGADVESAAKN